MLTITLPVIEMWDEQNEKFVYTKEQTLQLEHSLVSLSKWESKWLKPFLNAKEPKTREETVDYIRCMTLTKNVDPSVYSRIDDSIIKQVNEYIEAPMTATWFNDRPGSKTNSEQLTAELIYYYMIASGIPHEFEKWHLNRLITLIRICGIKSQSDKKMSRGEVLQQNAALNAARRKRFEKG